MNQTAQTETPRLLRVKEAARYLAVSPWTLRNLVSNGDLPVIRLGEHSAWLLDRRDLDVWIQAQKETL